MCSPVRGGIGHDKTPGGSLVYSAVRSRDQKLHCEGRELDFSLESWSYC